MCGPNMKSKLLYDSQFDNITALHMHHFLNFSNMDSQSLKKCLNINRINLTTNWLEGTGRFYTCSSSPYTPSAY